jgi:5-methylcytosine-specific restriction endonuclease McrA
MAMIDPHSAARRKYLERMVAENPGYYAQRSRERRERNPSYDAEWREKNRLKLRKQQKDFRDRHLEEERVRGKEKYWRIKENSPEIHKANWKKCDDQRLGTTKGKLHHSISVLMRYYLKSAKSGRSATSLVDWTIDQLKQHLEKQFKNGMTWENYGPYWHIDHKIPVSAFNFETPDDIDFKRCWALKNLQPLEAAKNISKGNRLERPFQPSLSIQL